MGKGHLRGDRLLRATMGFALPLGLTLERLDVLRRTCLLDTELLKLLALYALAALGQLERLQPRLLGVG